MNLLAKIFAAGLVIGLAAGLPAQTAMNFGNLPLWFEASRGQTEAGAGFIARGADSEFLIAPTQAQLVLRRSGGPMASCTMRFVGAGATTALSGEAELAGKINYLRGANPAQWQSGVPTFARVRAENVYPGVSVVYYGNQRQLEYDFNLAAGVDPGVIVLRFDGAERISTNPQGELVVSLPGGDLIQHPPVAYQTLHGLRREVAAGYKILDPHTAAFAIGNYDRTGPLVIDPVLSYSTFFGGNFGDRAHAVALDANGNIYIAGETFSTTFTNGLPLSTAGAFQTNFAGGKVTGDAFVAKFDYSGSNLLYFTYLGGSEDETILGLAVDNSGNAYLTGWTDSPDFPTNHVPARPASLGTIAGQKFSQTGQYPVDAFVAELNPSGTALVYSFYLGGNGFDVANAITLDSSGVAYVAGYTSSTNLPVTPDALQPLLACTNTFPGSFNFNAFVAAIAPAGTNLNYCSYFGGSNYDMATGIALDPAGHIFVAGYTASTNFPTTNGLAGFKHLNGTTNATTAYDVFVSQFQPGFGGLVYSTYLGGTNNDLAYGITADANGNAYIVGATVSTNFPYQPAEGFAFSTNLTSYLHTNTSGFFAFATNAFLTQIKWDGTNTSLGYSAVFGGRGNDFATAVALAPDGSVFVTGNASSTNFPMVNVTTNTGGLRATNSGLNDVFVIAFTNHASQIIYSTYLGGLNNDYAGGIAVDPLDAAYVVGQTLSTNFPLSGARQTFRNGTNDLFLAKLSIRPNVSVPNLMIIPPPAGNEPLPSPGITLAWQMFPPVYSLEFTTNLLSAGGWTVVPQSPVFSNGVYRVTLPATNNLQFFRLHQF